jgi:hypothetical protein
MFREDWNLRGMIALVSRRIGPMTSQNHKKSHIGRRLFLRIPGARLGVDYAKVPANVRHVGVGHEEAGRLWPRDSPSTSATLAPA